MLAFEISGDVTLWYQGRLCVPDVNGLQKEILDKEHESCYIVHPYSMKMCHDLMEMY